MFSGNTPFTGPRVHHQYQNQNQHQHQHQHQYQGHEYHRYQADRHMLPYGTAVIPSPYGVPLIPAPAFIPARPRLCHLKEAPHCHTVHPLGDPGTCCAGNCIVDARQGSTTLPDGTVVHVGKCHM